MTNCDRASSPPGLPKGSSPGHPTRIQYVSSAPGQMRSLFAGALLPCLWWLAIVAAGCDSAATNAKSNSGKATTPSPAPAADSVNECEGTLASIDEIFNLSRLERTTSISDGVLRLNDWQRTCAPAEDGAGPLPAEIRKLLSEPQIRGLDIRGLGEKRFTLRDGEHLRDCLLERTISRYAPGTGKSELERATHLFDHLVRAIGLVPAPPHDLPLTPYEVYLFGKGTAEDRAWIFVNVLRQLRIDAVLLFPTASGPASTQASAGPKFLVGVLLENQVFLFDPQSGVAIPAISADATGGLPRVATLAEAVAEPAVLKQLDAGPDRPYPISVEALRHPAVALVGDAGFWSARMQGLQTQFVGVRALVIADPLQDAGNASAGLYSRVVKAGGDSWTAADVRVWDHPETRLAAHVELTRFQQDSLIGMMRPFGAYKILASIDQRTGQPVFVGKEETEDPTGDKDLHPGVRMNKRTTAGEQMRARQLQMEGDFTQAIQIYTNVRSKSKDVLKARPDPLNRVMHAKAIDDAVFWTGLCQFEQGEFKSAVNTFQRYRKQPDEDSKWVRESRYLLARSLASAGDHTAAIAELEPVAPDDLEYLGYRWMIRRWQSASKSAVKTSAK